MVSKDKLRSYIVAASKLQLHELVVRKCKKEDFKIFELKHFALANYSFRKQTNGVFNFISMTKRKTISVVLDCFRASMRKNV